MQASETFKAGNILGLDVVGNNVTTFNGRTPYDVVDSAYQEWKQGQEATIPLLATLYSPPGNPLDINLTTTNTLPSNASSQIFLAPQAETPVTGEAWGLVFKYSCAPV
jgi:hypothetical protein